MNRQSWPDVTKSVVVLVTLAVCGCDHTAGKRRVLTVKEPGSGVGVRYPRGWSATSRNDTPVDNPALCFTVHRPRRLRVAEAEVKVVEYLPPLLRPFELRGSYPLFPPRPHHFRYGALAPSDASWTTGRSLGFREHGRAFFVGVTVDGRANAATRQTVERILDTIRVGEGRCRPSAGVGSGHPG